LKEIDDLIISGADANFSEDLSHPLIQELGSIRNLEIFKTLVQAGADINVRDNEGKHVLHRAVIEVGIYNGLDTIKYLIEEKGINIETIDKEGNTPLIDAVHGSCPNIFQYLLEKGANINYKNHLGFSPLCKAIIKLDLKTAQTLIEHGADVNNFVHYKISPIKLVVNRLSELRITYLQKNILKEITKLLIENGALIRDQLFYDNGLIKNSMDIILRELKDNFPKLVSKSIPQLKTIILDLNFKLFQDKVQPYIKKYLFLKDRHIILEKQTEQQLETLIASKNSHYLNQWLEKCGICHMKDRVIAQEPNNVLKKLPLDILKEIGSYIKISDIIPPVITRSEPIEIVPIEIQDLNKNIAEEDIIPLDIEISGSFCCFL
jgi:ankyrin repeat protein